MLVINDENVPLDSLVGASSAESMVSHFEFGGWPVTNADLFIALAGLVSLKDRKLGEDCLTAILESVNAGNPLTFGWTAGTI